MGIRVVCVILACLSACSCWPSSYNGKPACRPQRTPRHGSKWCLFDGYQAEVGTTCWFSCINGFHLRGPKVTKCVHDEISNKAVYNDTVGHCEPNAPDLHPGRNGPVLIHPYAPNNDVIYVGADKTVTLESYYYLALYMEIPGLNGHKNTVSFLVEGTDNKYITTNGTHVFTAELDILDYQHSDAATFLLRNDTFFEGYAAFESYTMNGYYLYHQSRQIRMHKVNRSIKDEVICASYLWTADL